MYLISAEKGGTGLNRELRFVSSSLIRSNNVFRNFDITSSGISISNSNQSSNSTTPTILLQNTGYNASSGTQIMQSLRGTINQSGTAAYKAFETSVYEQATGSGTKLLGDFGINSAADASGTHTSRFSVASNGEVNFGTLGRMFSNGNWFFGSTAVDAGFKLEVNGTSQFRNTMNFGSLSLVTSGGTFDFSNSITTQGNIRGLNGVTAGTTSPPVSSAIAEFVSTTRGFLPPRMTTAQINAISSPANGLVAYNTELSTLCFFNGTSWQKVSSTNMN